MNKNEILEQLTEITHQPFLVFANNLEEKTDNTFETLKLLATEEEVTAGRIAEVLDIKPSSVTQIIKKLEEAGTAIREKSEKDSRVTFVKITDKGQETLEEHRAINVTMKDVLFDRLSDEELEQLNHSLEIMLENISSKEFQEKLKDVFSNDARWARFGKMSPHFERSREQMLNQMMEQGRFGGFGHPRGRDRTRDPRRRGERFDHPFDDRFSGWKGRK
ncbi:MAG: MarR family winged helix-turn-helix transcriptional regulator [Enterococcus sp.]